MITDNDLTMMFQGKKVKRIDRWPNAKGDDTITATFEDGEWIEIPCSNLEKVHTQSCLGGLTAASEFLVKAHKEARLTEALSGADAIAARASKARQDGRIRGHFSIMPVHTGATQIVNYEPGNGTRYCITVVPVEPYLEVGRASYIDMQMLGCIDSKGYVIVNGLNGRSYLFYEDRGWLDESYVGEKLGVHAGEDARSVAEILRVILNRECVNP